MIIENNDFKIISLYFYDVLDIYMRRGELADYLNIDHDLGVFNIKPHTFIIYGLFWQIVMKENEIQIGCKIHSVDKWKSFINKEIECIHEYALFFASRYKSIILHIYKCIFKKMW